MAEKLLTGANSSKMQISPRRDHGFTLIEIMIVVSVIALLAMIAVPSFLRARKRSQAAVVLNDLRLLDAAIAQYAIDNNKATGVEITFQDLQPYLKKAGHFTTPGPTSWVTISGRSPSIHCRSFRQQPGRRFPM